jgi:O-methyltransferase involved in polyketide biosynthesis
MNNESKTLFIPLYGKAAMSKDGFYEDNKAEEIIEKVSFDFASIDKSKRLAIYMTMRAMQFDEITRSFISEYPNDIIITLGCGLDSRVARVEHKNCKWYDLDFPEVITIRKNFYVETDKFRMIPSSVTELSWLDRIEYDNGNVLIIAEGLTMYLTEYEMKALFEAFKSKFRRTFFVFDAYSSFAAKMSKYKNPVNSVNAKIRFAMDNSDFFEQDSIACRLNNDIIRKDYIDKLSGTYKMRFRFMRKFGSKLYRIYGYDIETK